MIESVTIDHQTGTVRLVTGDPSMPLSLEEARSAHVMLTAAIREVELSKARRGEL